MSNLKNKKYTLVSKKNVHILLFDLKIRWNIRKELNLSFLFPLIFCFRSGI